MRKAKPSALQGPKDSMAIGMKWCVLDRFAYLATFFLAADSAAAPTIVLVLVRWEAACHFARE